MLSPHTPEALAEALASAASRKQTISLCGKLSKRKMAGPLERSDVQISTRGLTRVRQYDPRDLTISVEAGLSWCALTQMLAEHRQMIPLDPPFADIATAGGVVAANCSGPRRRLYGTARDLVIGMQFATLAGKLVQSGGMVVKNVAGLDMAKLMIGSFGTLAAIAVINFKLMPMPEMERSFLLGFDSLAEAGTARDRVLNSVLQPAALDLLKPEAAGAFGGGRYVLAVQAGGNAASLERYRFELSALGDWAALEGEDEQAFWHYVREYPAHFLAGHRDGAAVRVSCTLKEMPAVVESIPAPVIARAGSGVCHGYFARTKEAAAWAAEGARRGWKAVIEFAPEAQKPKLELWPSPGGDFELMKRVKDMFDPDHLLNRGRMYRNF